MALDKIAIANIALSKIGAELLSGPNDDSNSARTIARCYDDVLDEVLVTNPWSFAQKRSVLAVSADAITWTDDTMQYKYVKPTDFLKLIYTNNQNAWVKVESDGILSDTANLKICYTFRNTDTTTYFPLFTQAFAARLAYEICFNLVQSTAKAENLFQEYKDKLASAAASDSQQGTPYEANQFEWENARLISSGGLYARPGQATWIPYW